MTDGELTIRPPIPADTETLLAGRDDQSMQWLGPADADPGPTACIVVGGAVVGWVDYDTDREWLAAGEVNIGYNVYPPYRRNGYASRAVELLLLHLEQSTQVHTATLLIAADNEASLGVAERTGFVAQTNSPRDHNIYFKRAV